MRTPAGTECRFYYQDFYRGRSLQECRLLGREPDSLPWTVQVCAICPVPAILRANSCPHMTLRGRLVRRWLRQRVVVEAVCEKYDSEVKNPYVGCGRCHPGAEVVLMPDEEERR